MLWQPIAAGANGLIPYAFHEIRRHSKGAERDAIWKMVCEAMAEVKAHEGILLSKPGPAATGAPAGLAVRTYRADCGKVYVLACNTSRSPLKASLRLAGRLGSPACLLGGGASSPEPGALALDMPPMGVTLVSLDVNANGK